MDQPRLDWVANFIWGIADDVLRDVYMHGKDRRVEPVPDVEPSKLLRVR